MKKYLQALVGLTALFFALLPASNVYADSAVTRQPWTVGSQSWLDLGNGPLVILAQQGNGNIYTSLGTGVGSTSGSSTTLTLTSTAAATPPCVGCAISGTGITAGTTVAAFNGTTGITLSAAMDVSASTALSWGMACPTSGAPPARLASPIQLRATGSFPPAVAPMQTYARLCVYGGNQGGLTGSSFITSHW